MRFSGPEPLTTPWAFERTGIIKTVRQKLNVPSERRIMDRPHVFSCDNKQVPRNWFASGKSIARISS